MVLVGASRPADEAFAAFVAALPDDAAPDGRPPRPGADEVQADRDQLVRELTDRADRAMPPMSLDPAAVLVGGRRHVGGVLRGDDDALEVAQLVTVGDLADRRPPSRR